MKKISHTHWFMRLDASALDRLCAHSSVFIQKKARDLTRTLATSKAVIAEPGERFNKSILTNIDIAQRSRELADTQSTIELLTREGAHWPDADGAPTGHGLWLPERTNDAKVDASTVANSTPISNETCVGDNLVTVHSFLLISACHIVEWIEDAKRPSSKKTRLLMTSNLLLLPFAPPDGGIR